MVSTFRLKKSELNQDFLDIISKLFQSDELVIHVLPKENEEDTTTYLMSDEKRKKALLHSLEEAKNGKLIAVNLNDY